ncbi:homoserine O-acetyltransferase MetX [Amycolatopsis cihanbeyliensis]|uniref:Homoserine O-acetyltransferase n=1 Tax=Amycolatopsis cihanbeyliensis TaxID=1128664 RepID=A0A542CSE1_AMYCI|nr:homoserine O-acetyltransferase [Amycolatopsis cihanbeyliensis]TQI93680.1 homoserine O-acetyltransferase [Amycolatopsis cihanbeyliensis]
MTAGVVPVTGAWRPGDPPGRRRWFTAPGPLPLSGGEVLPGYRLAYETWGVPSAGGGNAVLVLHALTGDSHAAGPAGAGHPTPGWWDGVIGPGRALDTRELFVVAPNVLGGCQGSTGPAGPAADGRPWGSRFPRLSIRDTVVAEAALADELGIREWALVLGGSMGGMRALEWAITFPNRVRRLLVLAACAASGADQIAWTAAQLAAIRGDPDWLGGDYHLTGSGPRCGLGTARRIAHTTYRSASELADRFGRTAQAGEDPHQGGRFAVESYLDHQAGKLAQRFDAASYVLLSEAMNRHDVGRGRAGVAAALRRIRAEVTVAGIDTDRLYPLQQQEELAAGIEGAGPVRVISSRYGHDGFLLETDQVGSLISELTSTVALSTG